MRRTLLMLTVAALMVAMLASNAASASAQIIFEPEQDPDSGEESSLEVAANVSVAEPFETFDDPVFGIDASGPQNKAVSKRGFTIVLP